MLNRRPISKNTSDHFFQEFLDDRAEVLLQALVAGCAIIAYADGWVTPEERKRMLGLLRRFEPLRAYAAADVVHCFEEMTARFAADHDDGEERALALVTKVRGHRLHSEMIVRSCCAVASADGAFDAEERAAASRITLALGLRPAEFDLVDAL